MITTEQNLSVLSAEVLRDLGRNESAGRAVRKMAIKMLIDRGHAFANHPDFRELRAEINEEAEAHAEVESLIGQVDEPTLELPEPYKDEVDESKCEYCGAIDNTHVNGCPARHHGPLKASFTTKDM